MGRILLEIGALLFLIGVILYGLIRGFVYPALVQDIDDDQRNYARIVFVVFSLIGIGFWMVGR